MATKQEKYDMSLDDVRSYLLETGAIQEAERILSLEPTAEVSKSAPAMESIVKPQDVYDRITRQRDNERENIMRNLLMQKHADSSALVKEEEDMRQLMDMEERLRKEQYEMEVAKQRLVEEMRTAKQTQLDDMAAEVRRELQTLEKQRTDMQVEMMRKQTEIEEIQREVRRAEVSLMEEEQSKQKSVEASLAVDYESAAEKLRQDMLLLAESHATSIAQSRAIKVSAARDTTQLQNGRGQSDYFASRMYQQQPAVERVQMSRQQQGVAQNPSSDESNRDGLVGTSLILNPSPSSMSAGKSAANSRPSLQPSPASADEPTPPSPVPSSAHGRSVVDSLLSDAGMRQQEERVKVLRSRVLQAGGGGAVSTSSPLLPPESSTSEAFPLHTPPRGQGYDAGLFPDMEPPQHARQLYEEARAGKTDSRLSVNGVPLSSADYLEKWLRNEVRQEDSAIMAPNRGLNISSSAGSAPSDMNQMAPSGSQRSGIGREDARHSDVNKLPQDALDVEMRDLQDAQPVLRSRSSHQALRPEVLPESKGSARGRIRLPTAGDSDDREYLYDRGFDIEQRKQGRAQRVQQPPRRGRDRDKDRERDRDEEGGSAVGRDPYGHPHSQLQYPPQNPYAPYPQPYGGPPHLGMMGSNPYGAPPYGGPVPGYSGYGMPPFHPPHPSMGQYPSPMGHQQQPYASYPPQYPPQHQPQAMGQVMHQEPLYMQQLQSLAEQLEKENAHLSVVGQRQSPARPTAPTVDSASPSGESVLPADGELPTYIRDGSGSDGGGGKASGGRRLNRAELKHREEMRQMQFEMEKLRQSQALEELRGDMERRRLAKKAESEHEDWLVEQKRQLQSLKIKQALAAEEEILKNKMGSPKVAEAACSVPPDASESAAEPKVPATLEPTELKDQSLYLDGLSFIVDGATVPLENIKGAEYRVACSMFSSAGKPLGRTQMSDWMVWERSPAGTVSAGKEVAVQFLSTPLSRKPPKNSKYSAKACSYKSEDELGNDTANFVTILVEMQCRDSSTGAARPVGWAVCSHPLASLPDDVLLGGREDDSRVYPGCWRLKIRRGMPNATGRQKATPEDATDGWMLFRVLPDKVALGDAKGCSGKDLGMAADLAALFDKYTPLEGGAVAPMIMPQQSSLKKMSSLMRPPSTGGLKTPGTAASRNIEHKPSTLSTSSRLSRATSKLDGKDMKNVASTKSLAALETVKDEDLPGETDKAADDTSNHSGPDSDTDDDEPEKVDPIAKFWASGTPNGPCNEKYQKGDGIDLYVDGAMFLPDNVAISRCVVKIMSSDYEVMGQTCETIAHLHEGSALSPVYRLKVEVRHAIMNTTATALIRIDAMTSNNCDSVGVGYAAIKLFSTRDREQPTKANAPGVFLNTGNFQLPLFGGRLQKAKLMNENCLAAAKMPRIPCASLLVRILPAPKSSDGIDVLSKADFPQADWARLRLMVPPPGVYLSGCYDGHMCEPLPGELHAFQAKAAHMTGSVLSVCRQAVAACSASRRPSHVSAPPDNATQDQLERWSQTLMSASSNMRMVLNYSLAVPYSFECGVSVAVDELHSLPDGGLFTSNDILHKIIFSTTPPGLLYRDPPLTEDVRFTHEVNTESSVLNPNFKDGFHLFHPTVIEKKLCIVLDVRTISLQFSKSKGDYNLTVEPAVKKKSYWTLLPIGIETIYGQGYTHVQTGVFQLPLIEGPVPPSILQAQDPFDELVTVLSQKKGPLKLCESGASVLVRVMNPLLMGIHGDIMEHWQDHITTTFLAEIVNGAMNAGNSTHPPDHYIYDMSRFYGGRTIEKQLNKTPDIKKLMKSVNVLFSETTRITSGAI